jgi:6-phosphogluconate dehydrogenase
MVHNAIEYGMMQAYAEGFELMHASPYKPDLAKVAELWDHGSVVRSWLLQLAARALKEDPDLTTLTGYVEDSGEGRWTVNAAIDEAVPAEVLTAALYTRLRSRREHTFAEKILSAMRAGFGGHKEPKQPGAAKPK